MVELGDQIRRKGLDVAGGDPHILVRSSFVSEPLDVVTKRLALLTVATINLGVENGLDFPLFFTVDHDGRRRRLSAFRERIGEVRLELGDVEDRVDGTKVGGSRMV